MQLCFETTRGFEEDLKELAPHDRARVVDCINEKGRQALEGARGYRRGLTRPIRFQLADDVDSSLYAMRAGPGLRVILAIVPDPIFDQLRVTLYRVVPTADAKSAYAKTGRLIYEPEGVFREQAEKRRGSGQGAARFLRSHPRSNEGASRRSKNGILGSSRRTGR
jgi:hypothetical protein